MKYQVYALSGNYKFEILDSCSKVVGTAHVELRHNAGGDFWHLEDLLIDKDNRSQGYGTALINYLKEYLWSVNKLRIRVHPAVGQQAMERIAEESQHYQQQYTEEELDEMDRKLQEEVQKPDFWKELGKMSKEYSSTGLKEWYMKRGFTVTYPSDEKHCWCIPSE